MVVRKYMSRQRCMNCTCHSPASNTRNDTGLPCTLILGWRNMSWTGNCSMQQFIPTIHVAIQLNVTTYNKVSQTNNRWFVLRTKIMCLGDCARHLFEGMRECCTEQGVTVLCMCRRYVCMFINASVCWIFASSILFCLPHKVQRPYSMWNMCGNQLCVEVSLQVCTRMQVDAMLR